MDTPTTTQSDLENRFGYHAPPDDETKARHEAVRAAGLAFAEAINSTVPKSREASSALTRVEEAMFWANAGIARISSGGARR